MNQFFNWTFDVAPGSSVRSRPVEQEFAAIGTGFDQVAVYFQRTMLAPTGETIAALPAKDARKNKSLVFDANGDPIAAVAATSEEMTAAVAAATICQTAAAEATAAAATVASLNSYIQQLMLAQGVV